MKIKYKYRKHKKDKKGRSSFCVHTKPNTSLLMNVSISVHECDVDVREGLFIWENTVAQWESFLFMARPF